MTNLIPKTVYTARAYLRNAKKEKVAISPEIEFVTADPYNISIALSVEEVTEQSATLVAEVEAGNQGLDLVFEYFKDGKRQNLETVAVSGIEPETIKKKLLNLNPETTYTAHAYLRNAKNKKVAFSSEVEFITEQTAASLNLSVKEVYRDRIVLKGEVKGRDEEEELGLWLECFAGRESRKIFIQNIVGTELQEIEQEIDGLAANTKYEITAYLQTESYFKLVVSDLEVQTPRSAILNLIATEVGLTNIDLSLELTPFEETAIIIEYQSEGQALSTLTSESYQGEAKIPVELKLENLEQGAVYTVTIKTDEVNNLPLEISLETYLAKDYDGNLYHGVKIGRQIFLRENLKATHFANGDPIPNVTDDDRWGALTRPAYCYYNNDPDLGEKYGALYNWYAASDPRGFIAGFHTPTIEEYQELARYVGPDYGSLKSTTPDWAEPNSEATNSSGFSALPAGARGDGTHFKFLALGYSATFWTGGIEPALPSAAYAAGLRYDNASFDTAGLDSKWRGHSIRLIKD